MCRDCLRVIDILVNGLHRSPGSGDVPQTLAFPGISVIVNYNTSSLNRIKHQGAPVMPHRFNQYLNEIISIFIMLMMLVAFVAEQDRAARLDDSASVPYSVNKASKVATESVRRSPEGGRRLFCEAARA